MPVASSKESLTRDPPGSPHRQSATAELWGRTCGVQITLRAALVGCWQIDAEFAAAPLRHEVMNARSGWQKPSSNSLTRIEAGPARAGQTRSHPRCP